jgi:hypothetical protein
MQRKEAKKLKTFDPVWFLGNEKPIVGIVSAKSEEVTNPIGTKKILFEIMTKNGFEYGSHMSLGSQSTYGELNASEVNLQIVSKEILIQK